MPNRFCQEIRSVRGILYLAFKKFIWMDGDQWAGAFSYHVFLSLLPLMILLVTAATFFISPDRAGKEVVTFVERYTPISGEMKQDIFNTVGGVIKARKQAGAFAFFLLVWVILQSFGTLIRATNRAWDVSAVFHWWRLPLKSMMMLGFLTGSVLLGLTMPVLIRMTNGQLFSVHAFHSWADGPVNFLFPLVALFFGLSLFYRLAPRRPTRFAEVWATALCATVLLRVGESLFVIYLKNFAALNAIYGTFSGVIALLLLIYVSGCIMIFGVCLCVAKAEWRPPSIKTAVVQYFSKGSAHAGI